MYILGSFFEPGKWSSQIIFLLALMVIGRFIFNEKNTRSNIFWNALGILTGLTIIRLLILKRHINTACMFHFQLTARAYHSAKMYITPKTRF